MNVCVCVSVCVSVCVCVCGLDMEMLEMLQINKYSKPYCTVNDDSLNFIDNFITWYNLLWTNIITNDLRVVSYGIFTDRKGSLSVHNRPHAYWFTARLCYGVVGMHSTGM